MIPSRIDEDAPPGEKAVFAALAGASGADDWVALHSLRLAEHPTQQRGEADFVVIAPGVGVVVVEVKSHLSVERDGQGAWLLGTSKPTMRGPFQQADTAKFAIEKFLAQRMGLTSIHVESCVWFTRLQARRDLAGSLEWHDWQLLDADDLTGDIVAVLTGVIDAGRANRARAGHRWPSIVGPGSAESHRIVSVLKPQLHSEPTRADLRRARDLELGQLLEEQSAVVAGLNGNDRIVVSGPAGCGKTLLALKAARAEASAGRRGLLLCFNRALAAHLQVQARDVPGLSVATLPGLMLEVAGLTPADDRDQTFWEETLPVAAWAAADGWDRVDYLVVDEAQDLCRPNWLDVMDQLVAGGLVEGRCLFFGDFDDQAIYTEAPAQVLRERMGPAAWFHLYTNCRNLPGIAAEAELLGASGGHPVLCRRAADGYRPTHLVYRDPVEQQSMLVQAVRDLRDDGFELHDIVVLSRYRDSAAQRCTDGWLAPLLVDYRQGGPVVKGNVRYSTIHSFKGLEAPAVIITDVNVSSRGPYHDLINVGITRAQDRLTILATEDGLAHLGAR